MRCLIQVILQFTSNLLLELANLVLGKAYLPPPTLALKLLLNRHPLPQLVFNRLMTRVVDLPVVMASREALLREEEVPMEVVPLVEIRQVVEVDLDMIARAICQSQNKRQRKRKMVKRLIQIVMRKIMEPFRHRALSLAREVPSLSSPSMLNPTAPT